MNFSFLAVLMAFSFSSFARTQVCTYEYNKEGSSLSWTAFKTPKKVGVKAKFSDFTVDAKNSSTIDLLLSSASIVVNSQSVESGDKGRDTKIMFFFFKKMLSGTNITGKILKVDQDKVEVEFSMNGVSKIVEMIKSFDKKSGLLSLVGKINVLDFKLKPSLDAITKACYEKHEGVTWPDVDLEFSANVKSSCK
jgi:hypothetical protein